MSVRGARWLRVRGARWLRVRERRHLLSLRRTGWRITNSLSSHRISTEPITPSTSPRKSLTRRSLTNWKITSRRSLIATGRRHLARRESSTRNVCARIHIARGTVIARHHGIQLFQKQRLFGACRYVIPRSLPIACDVTIGTFGLGSIIVSFMRKDWWAERVMAWRLIRPHLIHVIHHPSSLRKIGFSGLRIRVCIASASRRGRCGV